MSTGPHVYDVTPTEGDPYEREDRVIPLKQGDLVLSTQPLSVDESGGIGGGGDVVLRPGDTYADTVGFEQLVTWFASAPSGASLTEQVERQANTGGHLHGGAVQSEEAAGRIDPKQIAFSGPWPQNVLCTFLSPIVAGRITHYVVFAGEAPITIYYEVKLAGLVRIAGSESLKLKLPTSDHPSPYWGTPAFAAKLQSLASQYFAATGDAITCTDASLEWGGRFDLNLDWRPPHAEHFYGNTADIRSFDIKDPQAFDSAAAAAGLTVLVESNHYHVRG